MLHSKYFYFCIEFRKVRKGRVYILFERESSKKIETYKMTGEKRKEIQSKTDRQIRNQINLTRGVKRKGACRLYAPFARKNNVQNKLLYIFFRKRIHFHAL